MEHKPVLVDGVIKRLNINSEGTYVDCTLGLGGHSSLIAAKCKRLIAFDQDKSALSKAKENLKEFDNITFINDNFQNIKERLNEIGIDKVDGILYDLGTSYYQLTDDNRGFTYHGETKLDMRMNQDQELSAIDVINKYSEEELVDIFYKYGDESRAKQIAKAICEHREVKEITLNTELNEIIKEVKGFQKDKHPSKNVYQAIRIEVNNEIGVIKDSIEQSIELLKKNGTICVITFHSLEDKTVKNIFWNKKEEIDITPMGNEHKFQAKKTIYPTKEEIEQNNSSRSAKLRTLVKLID